MTRLKNKNLAFTLAEVLITLGVIGVVAAMTLPSIISKYQERAMVEKLKKTYSTIQNAFNLAINENGNVNEFTTFSSNGIDSINDVTDILKNYLKINETLYEISRGYNNKFMQLRNYTNYNQAYANGHPFSYFGNKYILNDGTLFTISIMGDGNSDKYWCKNRYSSNSYCGFIYTDLNGYEKGPNKFGYDTFAFYIYYNKIIPFGTPGYNYFGTVDDCLSGQNGLNCAAWVLLNNNMDYLHCDDLSWNGKTKCK